MIPSELQLGRGSPAFKKVVPPELLGDKEKSIVLVLGAMAGQAMGSWQSSHK